MAGESTALIIVSNYRSGPFQDRIWKARHGITLIEKLTPLWTVDRLGYSTSDLSQSHGIDFLEGNSLAEELVFIIAATVVRDQSLLELLSKEDLATKGEDGVFEMNVPKPIRSSGLKLSPEVIEHSVAALQNVVRLGIVRLSLSTHFDENCVKWLRLRGLDVDVFGIVDGDSQHLN